MYKDTISNPTMLQGGRSEFAKSQLAVITQPKSGKCEELHNARYRWYGADGLTSMSCTVAA